MGIFDLFRTGRQRTAAMVAKERLQIVVSHKSKHKDPEFLQRLHNELVAVISKYIHIEADQIRVQLGEKGDFSVLELNVTLPPNATEHIAQTMAPVDTSSIATTTT